MAITRPDAATFHPLSVNSGDPESFSHEVTSDTTLLIVAVSFKANEEISSVTWNSNSLSLIVDVDDSINTGSVTVEVWGMINPAPATANVVVTPSTGPLGTWSWFAALNYKGTVIDSVAAATNVLSTDLNNGDIAGTTSTNVHASAGTSGNALLFIGTQNGADGLPVSNNASFGEVIEQETGGGSTTAADATAYVAELLTGLPSAITVTFNQDDDNVGVLIELVAAAAAAGRGWSAIAQGNFFSSIR